MSEWLAVEAIVRQRDKETQASAIAKLSSESMSGEQMPNQMQRDLSNDVSKKKHELIRKMIIFSLQVFEDISDYDYESNDDDQTEESTEKRISKQNTIKYESDEEASKTEENDNRRRDSSDSCASKKGTNTRRRSKDERKRSLEKRKSDETVDPKPSDTREDEAALELVHSVIVTNASIDVQNIPLEAVARNNNLDAVTEENCVLDTLDCIETHGLVSPARSVCVSPASSNGGVYSVRLLFY